MKEKNGISNNDSYASLDKDIIAADPLGSYTGVPLNPEEKPIQDADDL